MQSTPLTIMINPIYTILIHDRHHPYCPHNRPHHVASRNCTLMIDPICTLMIHDRPKPQYYDPICTIIIGPKSQSIHAIAIRSRYHQILCGPLHHDRSHLHSYHHDQSQSTPTIIMCFKSVSSSWLAVPILRLWDCGWVPIRMIMIDCMFMTL